MKKFIALAAVLACLKEGNDVTEAQITAVQAELTDADTGLVLITAEQNRKANDAFKKISALEADATAITALFGEAAKAEGFDLKASIKAALEKAEKFDAADGAANHKETKETPEDKLTPEQQWQKTYASLPHNQNAEKVLG